MRASTADQPRTPCRNARSKVVVGLARVISREWSCTLTPPTTQTRSRSPCSPDKPLDPSSEHAVPGQAVVVLPQQSAPLPRGGNAVLVEVVDGLCAVRTSGQGTVCLPPSRVRHARDVVGGAEGVGDGGEGGSQSLEGMIEELARAKNEIAELRSCNARLVLDATANLEVSRSQALAQDVRKNNKFTYLTRHPRLPSSPSSHFS
jgi:hypothetical protein